MKPTWKTITKILENNGFTTEITKADPNSTTEITVTTTTSLGEDIELSYIAATPEEFINQFSKDTIEFNPAEHAKDNLSLSICSDTDIEQLIEDAYKFQKTLKQTEKELRHFNWDEADKTTDTLQAIIQETIEKTNELYQFTKETNEILNNLLENEQIKETFKKTKGKKLKSNIILAQSYLAILIRNLEVAKSNFGHAESETYD